MQQHLPIQSRNMCSANMDFQKKLSPTEDQYLPPTFGQHLHDNWEFTISSRQLITHKQTDKPNKRIAYSNNTYDHMSITNKTIGFRYYHQRNLHTTAHITNRQKHHRSTPTTDTNQRYIRRRFRIPTILPQTSKHTNYRDYTTPYETNFLLFSKEWRNTTTNQG
jgi:hypothetical protein